MARYRRFPSWGTRLKIICIILAILAILALQFFWFSNSARSTIESAYQAISSNIHRTASREFHRYDDLLKDILRLRRDGTESEQSLKAFLESAIRNYGPERADLPLLTFAGYSRFPASAGIALLKGSGGGWSVARDPALGIVPDEITDRLEAGDCIVHSSEESPPEDILLLHVLDSSGLEYRVVIGLDIEGFFSAFVEPAIASSLAEYSIEWSLSAPPPPGEPGGQDPKREYRFNPLRGLLRKEGAGYPSSEFLMYIPRVFIGIPERASEGIPPSWESSTQTGAYRSIQSVLTQRSNIFGKSFRTARIQMQNMPFEQAIERQHSFSWLGGTVLLIGIGISFSFLVLQQERLARLRAMEKEFAAAMTHELRTPLTVILSAAENIKTGIVPEVKLKRYADLITEQSKRLGRMIDDALSFVSMEARPAGIPRPLVIDAKEFMDSLRLSMDPLARQMGTEILWDAASLPETFKGDEKGLELVLVNLIANAVHHAYPGRDKGSIRVSGGIARRGEILLVVEDDGRGIDPRESKHVFDPFYRDRVSKENQERGSGLGLYLARKKALSLGGTIRLESPYRRADGSMRPGCRFILKLPRASEVGHER